jgi:hypothetical protein
VDYFIRALKEYVDGSCGVGFHCDLKQSTYRGTDKSLAQPGRKEATATEDMYKTRLASNEIFLP